MPGSAIQGTDRFPFIRPGVKNNFSASFQELGAFIGGGSAVNCFYTPQVSELDEVLGFGGTCRDTIFSTPEQFDSLYVATFNNNTDESIFVEYFQNLVVHTGTNRVTLDSAALSIGLQEPVLSLGYTLMSMLFVENNGEVVNNQFFFVDNFQKNVGGGYLLEHKKTHVMNNVFEIPPQSYATIRYAIAATKLSFYGSVQPLSFDELAFLRVTEGRPDGYEPLNTKTFQ